jgi:hypothetical protein
VETQNVRIGKKCYKAVKNCHDLINNEIERGKRNRKTADKRDLNDEKIH